MTPGIVAGRSRSGRPARGEHRGPDELVLPPRRRALVGRVRLCRRRTLEGTPAPGVRPAGRRHRRGDRGAPGAPRHRRLGVARPIRGRGQRLHGPEDWVAARAGRVRPAGRHRGGPPAAHPHAGPRVAAGDVRELWLVLGGSAPAGDDPGAPVRGARGPAGRRGVRIRGSRSSSWTSSPRCGSPAGPAARSCTRWRSMPSASSDPTIGSASPADPIGRGRRRRACTRRVPGRVSRRAPASATSRRPAGTPACRRRAAPARCRPRPTARRPGCRWPSRPAWRWSPAACRSPCRATPCDDTEGVDAGDTLPLGQARDGDGLVVEPHHEGAQPTRRERAASSWRRASARLGSTPKISPLQRLVVVHRARLDRLEPEPRVEVRHHRRVADPEDRLAQQPAPAERGHRLGPGPVAGRAGRPAAATARCRRGAWLVPPGRGMTASVAASQRGIAA